MIQKGIITNTRWRGREEEGIEIIKSYDTLEDERAAMVNIIEDETDFYDEDIFLDNDYEDEEGGEE